MLYGENNEKLNWQSSGNTLLSLVILTVSINGRFECVEGPVWMITLPGGNSALILRSICCMLCEFLSCPF